MTTPFDPLPQSHRRPGLFARLRSNFLTGVVVILPVSLTIWLIWTLIGWVDSVILPLVPGRFRPENYIGINLRGLGLVIFLVFTITVGWIAKGLIGRSLIGLAEGLVERMPVIRSVYSGLKQIAETVFAQSDRSFEKACMIEYPRRGVWGIGFISTAAKGEIQARSPSGAELVSVFLPTTPNPTSGFLLYVPREDVVELDMSVEDAAKLIISAGLVYPTPKDAAEALADLPETPPKRRRWFRRR